MKLHTLFSLALGVFVVGGAMAACSSGVSGSSSTSPTPASTSTSDPNDPVGSGDGGADGSSTEAKPPAASGPACATADECPYWYCDCESGPPVNTRHCTNGRCENAAQACPRSCKGFGTCWTGIASGGWDGGTNAGPNECASTPADGGAGGGGCGDGTAYSDIGKACAGDAQCQSGQCWGVSPSFLCTKRCTSSSECPKSWRCVTNGNGFQICMQGNKNATTPLSTNTSCAQVTFTDLGGACVQPTDCQSYICLGSQYCSRRCEVAADCPAGWTCTAGTSFKYCTK